MKDWMKDIMFIAHVVIIVPIISVIYFGYAFTNLSIIFVLIGAIVLWSIIIIYPFYWYLKNRIFI